MKVPSAALDLVRHFEGLMRVPYMDSAGIWTIGVGHAIRDGGRFLRGDADRARAEAMFKTPLLDEDIDALLEEDLRDADETVAMYVDVDLTENQRAALISFVFNVGAMAFAQSTLLKLLNAGHIAGAASQFGRWTHAAGKVLPGLVRRREAERELFEKPV